MELEKDPRPEKREQRWKERLDPGSHSASEPANKNVPKDPDPAYTDGQHKLKQDMKDDEKRGITASGQPARHIDEDLKDD